MYTVRQIIKHLLQLKVLFAVFIGILAPLFLVLDIGTQESRCAYVIVVMAILWLTEAIPIPVTALLPIFMFPMLGVAEAKDISSAYVTDTTMLFLGGLVLAVAVEESNLHSRIALGVMRTIGAHPSMLMIGLMVTTWFLSMWISNTAATSMMIPIINAVIHTCEQVNTIQANTIGETIGETNAAFQVITTVDTTEPVSTPKAPSDSVQRKSSSTAGPRPPLARRKSCSACAADIIATKSKAMRRLAKGLCISVAYAANIGGVATLTGTPPNLVLKDRADKLYINASGNADEVSPLSFAVWMGFALPLSLLTLVLAWVWIQIMFLRGRCCKKVDEDTKVAVNATIKKQFKELGRMTFAEWMVLLNFIAIVVLWLFRDPPGYKGWGETYYNKTENKRYISDSTPAILISVILFIVPSHIPNVFCLAKDRDKPSYTPILTWKVVEKKIPWGVIVLLGGGFAIAKASEQSGLSRTLGNELKFFASYDTWVMNLIFAVLIAAATEVASNTATATLLMPILSSLALSIDVHPLYLMITATVATSFAFMLPVATPPNAIVFSTGYLTIKDMALAGLPMNIVSVLCLTLAINTWGSSIFNLEKMPDVFVKYANNSTALDILKS